MAEPCGDPDDDSWCCCVCNKCSLCEEGTDACGHGDNPDETCDGCYG